MADQSVPLNFSQIEDKLKIAKDILRRGPGYDQQLKNFTEEVDKLVGTKNSCFGKGMIDLPSFQKAVRSAVKGLDFALVKYNLPS